MPPVYFAPVLVALALMGAPAESAGLLQGEYRPLTSRETVDIGERFGGQVVLVVNTASKCGLTPQYEGLEALHQRYSPRGFAVLGFPSGDFMGQEFEDEAEIAEFCTNTYGVKFPMFQRVHVRGDAAIPLFRDLARAAGEAPAWNFHKYLLDREGNFVASFGSRVNPEDPALVARIEALLAEGGTP